MATYKVIQDIEAEDHILGPLSLRQFIYGLVAVFLLYLCFIAITRHVAFLVALFLPPALFAAFFAIPFGRDQPTEIWALAKIRFLFKPRKRIWNQTGIKELVTITVPKKIETQLTDGLSQTEVKSRLRALADTIDSRGWAVKNASIGVYARPGLVGQSDSERLLSIGNIPRPVSEFDDGPDILDESTSPLARQFSSLIDASTKNRRKQLIEQLNAATPAAGSQPMPQPQWFAQPAVPVQQPIVSASPMAPQDDAALTAELQAKLAAQAQANARLRTIPVNPTPQPAAPPVTPQPDPAILNLAKNNDLNVATLAREAGKAKGLDSGDEVVISLH